MVTAARQPPLLLAYAVALTVATCNAQSSNAAVRDTESIVAAVQAGAKLRMNMRRLWGEQAVYMRDYIVSSLAGLDDADAITERLMRNQDDIGNAFKPFYGEGGGAKLSALLRTHVMIAMRVVSARKNGNDVAVSGEQRVWDQNADDIASFLSAANPAWPKPSIAAMLFKHLDYTNAETVARLKKDWHGDIAAYDKEYGHMLQLADMLADGLVRQFPRTVSRQ